MRNNVKQFFSNDRSLSVLTINQCHDDNIVLTFFVPTFKRIDTLKDTLDSIKNNRFQFGYQILIVDNSSDFSNENKTKELVEQYPSLPIDYYINKTNLGMEGNWNQGLILSKSEYISFIHDDDLIAVDFCKYVEQIVNILKKNKKCAYFKARYNYFSKLDDIKCLEKSNNPKKFLFKCTKGSALVIGNNQTCTPSCGMIFKKSVLIEIGGFDPSYHPSSDNEIGTRLFQNGYYGFASSWICGHYRLGLNESMKITTTQAFIEKNHIIRHNNYRLGLFPRLFSILFEKYLYSSDIDFWIRYSKEKFNVAISVEELDFKNQYKKYKRKPFLLRVIGNLDYRFCKKYRII